jgi:hypothetical protein
MPSGVMERGTGVCCFVVRFQSGLEDFSMTRIGTLAVGAATSVALVAGSLSAAEAAPLPAQTAVQLAGDNAVVDHVRYRRYGYGYGRGYGYRRGYGGRAAGALAAGAALGLIGGAIAASSAPRYGYYDYGYPAYGYAPAYGYGYAPTATYGYGYPAYGYGW